MEGIFLMVDTSKRRRFGKVVKEKRKKLGLDQEQLGLEVWGAQGVSPSAAQTRISRIERGDYWPPREDVHKIIDHLNIWDEAFAGPAIEDIAEDAIFLDPAWEEFVPNLRQMVQMMSDFARKGNATHFYHTLQLLCDVAKFEQEKTTDGDP